MTAIKLSSELARNKLLDADRTRVGLVSFLCILEELQSTRSENAFQQALTNQCRILNSQVRKHICAIPHITFCPASSVTNCWRCIWQCRHSLSTPSTIDLYNLCSLFFHQIVVCCLKHPDHSGNVHTFGQTTIFRNNLLTPSWAIITICLWKDTHSHIPRSTEHSLAALQGQCIPSIHPLPNSDPICTTLLEFFQNASSHGTFS
mmetsp:Transcript_52778/g.83797  ORF Transcript_52778/g.83797 Transcript_52778/m.83797 type:complete len:204 (+) Transcript_52778:276-887(+)